VCKISEKLNLGKKLANTRNADFGKMAKKLARGAIWKFFLQRFYTLASPTTVPKKQSLEIGFPQYLRHKKDFMNENWQAQSPY